MLVEGNTSPGGGLTGRSVPLPTTARPLPQRARRTGLDWAAHTTGPDPDAIARLTRLGIVTVTHETVEDKPVRVVRRRRPKKTGIKRTPGPSTGVTYTPRFDVDKAVELYLSGLTVRQVADALGVKQNSSIRSRLTQRGIELRPRVTTTRRHNHPVEKVAADYLAGASMRALAVKYSASKGTVKKILVAQGVTLRDDGIPRSQRGARAL